ncbi:hypothetical protein CIB95_02530 [Lottiidibacillus patelloidae]|uniref:Uncharacterized protein n=1 Tax=Lottiidibacillus patelloidae TaxID=2670334 RepID=A0A263BXK1_9BACI|nr:hypothetical protein [Lottiidibacillus patelloidae]OZM58463.1 hypothetical protein CIB95_02530 [Lottiidibacillus patelloidae]
MFRIIVAAMFFIVLSQTGVVTTVLANCEGCPGETLMDVKIRNILDYFYLFGIIAISIFLFLYFWIKRSKK